MSLALCGRRNTKENRLASRWAPEGAEKFEHAETGVVAFLFPSPRNGKPAAIVYVGTAAKPCGHYHFNDEWKRAEYVMRVCEGQRKTAEFRTEQRAKRNAPHTLEVGHILVSSWGYDQTNVDYYQVTKVSAHMVEVREIGLAAMTTGGEGMSSMSDYVIPCPDQFIGETTRHLVGPSNSIRISSCQHARLWDGRKNYRSWYA